MPLHGKAVSASSQRAGTDGNTAISTHQRICTKGHAVILIGRSIPAYSEPAEVTRRRTVADYHAARSKTAGQAAGSYRPLDVAALYLPDSEFAAIVSAWPVHKADIFAQPESASVIDFGFSSSRDFSPELARGDNVYQAAALHFRGLAAQGRKPLLASSA